MGGLPPASPRRHAWALAGLFCAITACFVVYSLIQERLVTLGFGPQQERFRHSLFIILVNRLVAVAVAASALAAQGQRLAPAAPLALFGVPSVANVLGSASQYEALKYVSFPLQALAKCAKTVRAAACCCWGHQGGHAAAKRAGVAELVGPCIWCVASVDCFVFHAQQHTACLPQPPTPPTTLT